MSVRVLVPAAATALTTKEHVRGDLGAMAAGVSDPQLDRWIAQASATAASFCRRTFGRERVREHIGIAAGRIDDERGGLLLDRGPIVSVVSVTVDGITLAPEEYEADERFLYRLQADGRRVWHGRAVVVEYEAGWALPGDDDFDEPEGDARPLPADIERAVIQLVGVSVSAAGRDAMVKSESVEGVGSQSFYVQGSGSALAHPEAEATLAQYRRLCLG